MSRILDKPEFYRTIKALSLDPWSARVGSTESGPELIYNWMKGLGTEEVTEIVIWALGRVGDPELADKILRVAWTSNVYWRLERPDLKKRVSERIHK